MTSAPFRIGTRSSRLALIQCRQALALLGCRLPAFAWERVPFSSPGDRDKAADLASAPADFFTRDLDDAVRSGVIDGAVHSAKDLPDPLPEGIDVFWLPDAADPRDVVVGSLAPRVVGVSSERRTAYVARRFPDARTVPVRGTIEERLAQLDAGAFDALIMAAAALQRLGLDDQIAEWIAPDGLPVPEGQGALAVTFRRGDPRMVRVRSLFVRPVAFVGAGIGRGHCTQAGVLALRQATVCLYDALLDPALLDELPATARRVYVGKRSGEHSASQAEICAELVRLARQGERVVRLKGGDPGIYGRLAEEVEALDAEQLPYRVVPGVSSLSVATTGTGLLLTRRGVADRFRVFTARTAAGAPGGETAVSFMGVQALEEASGRLIREGLPPTTPAALVLDAGGPCQRIVGASLADIAAAVPGTALPGLLLVGETASATYLYRHHGALRGRRVWLTCSRDVQERAARAVVDYGGVPVQQPLIELVPDSLPTLEGYDWLILTSPSAVRCCLSQVGDVRTLPRILCCGEGTAAALALFRVKADAMPDGDFSTEGVLRTAQSVIPATARVCRLRSDRAGSGLSARLRPSFARVDDVVVCRNRPVRCDLPESDAVFLASASAVDSFVEQFGTDALREKDVVVIGARDAAALRRHGIENAIAPPRATVEDAIAVYADRCVERELSGQTPET